MPIPKIFHFTWKGEKLPPRLKVLLDRWRELHPGWEFRFYDDAALRAFVAGEFPEHLELYDSYPMQIQRVDAFRYMVLSRVGGIYSDLDVEPYRAIDELIGRTSCFVGAEPEQHMRQLYNSNGIPFLLCNAFMGSEPGHPFWQHVFDWMHRRRDAAVMLSTGPWFLTGAGLTAGPGVRPDLLSPDYWTPITYDGSTDTPGPEFLARLERHFRVVGAGDAALCSHLWYQSWVGFGMKDFNDRNILKAPSRLKWRWRRRRHPELIDMEKALPWPAKDYDDQVLKPVAELPTLYIATPVKDAERFLPRYAELVEALDYPPERISVGLLVSDSVDRTLEVARELAERWRGRFRGVDIIERNFGFFLGKTPRWRPRLQLRRRGILGACRTELAQRAAQTSDYCLFLDVDLSEMPRDAVQTMLSARRPVVMANCLDEHGKVFDANAFLYSRRPTFRYLYLFGGLEGLLHPPHGANRHYLPELAYLRVTPLDAVGGTLLLVDNSVFRAGVVFPAEPYKLHIETEGFAVMARDKGFEVCGMPELVVVHPRHD